MTGPKIVATRKIEAGGAILGVIGRSHTLPTAIADLIDNSITHSSSAINIRFNDRKGVLESIRIRDNGSGMDGEALDYAMQLSPDSNRPRAGLSMFGIGLKASSLSIGSTVIVYACPSAGDYHGAVLDEELASESPQYGEVSHSDAAEGFLYGLGEIEPDDPASTGVVIEISGLRSVPASKREHDRSEWLSNTINELAQHLGLVFHRYLDQHQIEISIERFSLDSEKSGATTYVQGLDPLGFSSSPDSRFPCVLSKTSPQLGKMELRCVMVPPGSKTSASEPLGLSRESAQGLYIYWKDRLIDWGGWHAIRPVRKEGQLARASLDVTEKMVDTGVVRMNKEKTQVQLLPQVTNAIPDATDNSGSMNIEAFLHAAEEVLKSSRRRDPKAKPLTRAGSGIPEAVKAAVEETVGWRNEGRQVNAAWKFLPEDDLFDVDIESRTIQLNSRHRVLLSNTADNTHEDAPVTRTLLFLLLEELLRGQRLGPAARDQVEGYKEILSAALLVQLDEVKSQAVRDFASKEPEPVPTGYTTRQVKETSAAAKHATESAQKEHPSNVEEYAPKVAAPNPLSVAAFRRKAREASSLSESSAARQQLPDTRLAVVLKAYRAGKGTQQIATEESLSEREVVCAIGAEVFGDSSVSGDTSLAARHGLPWDPPERERLRRDFQALQDPVKIAETLQRTALGVTWQLLKLPERPVKVSPNLIRRVSKRNGS